uniref:Transposase domain-containing protein n=2 Tax=Trichogramma kaykai TaxID=54128 RepID=A0ABD2WZ19_9HYME
MKASKLYLELGDIGITPSMAYRYKVKRRKIKKVPMDEVFQNEDIFVPNDFENHCGFTNDEEAFLKPKNFEEFVGNPVFYKKIQTKVNLTRGELFLMLLKYASVNKASKTAMSNLFTLINTMFEAPVLPSSTYMLDKILNPDGGVEFHAVCQKCSAYLGEFSENNDNKCPTCDNNIDLSKKSNDCFFALFDPSNQIADLINTYEEHYEYVTKHRISHDHKIEDVYDANMYKLFRTSLPEEDKKNYITTVLNTDGASKFKSSKKSIWPLYLMVNEIPKQDRLNNVICCGLWCNKTKPDMNLFLDKFVDIILQLRTSGIKCLIKNETKFLKPYVLTCCVDAVARAPIQGIKQFNGHYGCNWCLHPGHYANKTMHYPYSDNPNRDHNDMIQLMLTANPKRPVQGVMYASPLINLPFFNVVEGFIPDFMHCCLEGVAEQMINFYLEGMDEDDIEFLDNHLLNIATPKQLARSSRKLSERNDWKAREWENFTLYYSIPVLSLKISKNYLDHWILFVEGLYLITQDSITQDDLNRADELFHQFIKKIKTFPDHGLHLMTYNMHLLLHICKSVLNWGPVTINSTYPFESANRGALIAIKCSKGAPQQVRRWNNINHSILSIERKLSSSMHDEVIHFCDNILFSKVQNIATSGSITYFGRGDYINNDSSSNRTIEYEKMVKDKCVYESYEIDKRRCDNSFALLDDGTYVKIKKFTVNQCTGREETVCHVIKTKAYSKSYKILRKIDSVSNETIKVSTKKICKICIFIDLNIELPFGTRRKLLDTFICPVSNLLHY